MADAADLGVARRPVQNYLEMGFAAGERVEIDGFPDEDVTVADGRRLLWNGRAVSLLELRRQLGARQGVQLFRGKISIAGRPLDAAYNETYGPKVSGDAPMHQTISLRDVVPSLDALMGVKAVWGKSREAVMCFGSRGDARLRIAATFNRRASRRNGRWNAPS